MAKTPSDHLLQSLEDLVPYDFEKFKFKLQNTSLEKEQTRIPRGLLQMARPVKLASLLVDHYGEEDAIRLTLQVLRGINQRLVAEELLKATSQVNPIQEVGTNSSSVSCSSEESKSKSLKIPDGPEGDGPQSGEGHSGQCEAVKGTQKKLQDRRRDQGLDGQSKPGTRNITPLSKRGPSLPFTRLPGEKACISSSRLRRNAHSSSGLKNLSSHSFSGTLARREPKRGEPKKRPKSLEFEDSLVKGGPLNPEALLTLKEMAILSPDSETTPETDVKALVATEKGSGVPEYSVSLEGGDLVGGTCVHSSSNHSGDHGTSISHSASCPQCQALLLRKQQKLPQSLSPEPPPQCERHMKQPCLLFCEDHRQPICLICSLSQEHRGHQVRPIEEAALEYQEQIRWQLEHLKELRKSGEEQKSQGDREKANFLEQTEAQKRKVRCQMKQLCHFLEKQEQLFVAWLEELGQTIGQTVEQYGSQVSQDMALLDELIGELEARQQQSAWALLQDIGVTLHRAKMVTVPKHWVTPSEVKEKMHLLYHKSEFMEKNMKRFSVPELKAAQTYAVDVILDAKTAHPNLIFSDDLKSVRLGNKHDRLPEHPERFDSCILALGTPTFLSGRQYWEVEVGDKTGWILGVCRTSMSRKGSLTLSTENGYWVVMMTMAKEYQVSTFPPTRLWLKQPPRRVGIFLDYDSGDISFYNVAAKSHIYTFTCCPPSGPLQPIFGPGTNDGGKNTDPLTICQVHVQEPH
ncbi:pyrin [Rhynchocyon petersi]